MKSTKHGGRRPGAGRPRKADVVPPPDGQVSHREAVRRKEAALAQLRELELAKARGELVTVESVKRELTGIAASVRQALERLPDQLAPQLAAEADETKIAVLLAAEIDRVLLDLAQQLAEAP